MQKKELKTYWVNIHIAGDINVIENVCRKFCFGVGLCVTVRYEKFIYTGGQEDGAIIGLINYPRFPADSEDVLGKAMKLALDLKKETFQWSVLIQTPIKTFWLTDRDEKK